MLAPKLHSGTSKTKAKIEKKFGEYETEDRGIQDSEPTVDFF